MANDAARGLDVSGCEDPFPSRFGCVWVLQTPCQPFSGSGIIEEAGRCSSITVLDAELATGIDPGDSLIDTRDHAGAALQASGKLDLHLPALFIEFVKMGRACKDTEPFLTVLALLLIKGDMALSIVLESVDGDFFFDLHMPPLIVRFLSGSIDP
jgi:hypothetical protein